MWIDHVDGTAVVEGQEAGGGEIEIVIDGLGGERIRLSCCSRARVIERLAQESVIGSSPICLVAKEQTHRGEEGRLAVELEVIFTLKDVVEDADTAADAGLAVPGGI